MSYNDREWLALLKVGDRVIFGGSALNSDRIGTIVRFTKNFIIASLDSGNSAYEYKFRKESGHETGGGYHRSFLREATKERVDAIKLDYLRYRVKSLFHDKIDWDTVPLETLEQLKEIGKAFLKKEKV
jgi:hypothetical protein